MHLRHGTGLLPYKGKVQQLSDDVEILFFHCKGSLRAHSGKVRGLGVGGQQTGVVSDLKNLAVKLVCRHSLSHGNLPEFYQILDQLRLDVAPPSSSGETNQCRQGGVG